MGELHQTSVSLRFFGDDLDPDEITAALGASPTVGVRKGGVWLTSRGVEKVAGTGSWRRHVERRQPGNLDGQIVEGSRIVAIARDARTDDEYRSRVREALAKHLSVVAQSQHAPESRVDIYNLITRTEGHPLSGAFHELAEQIGILQSRLRGSVLAGILDGDTYLVCQGAQIPNVFLVKCVWFIALYIQRANDLSACLQRQGQF